MKFKDLGSLMQRYKKWYRIVRALLVHEPRLLIALADMLMMLRIPRTMRWLMTFPKDSYGAYLSSFVSACWCFQYNQPRAMAN
jgi:hypothetical protein